MEIYRVARRGVGAPGGEELCTHKQVSADNQYLNGYFKIHTLHTVKKY